MIVRILFTGGFTNTQPKELINTKVIKTNDKVGLMNLRASRRLWVLNGWLMAEPPPPVQNTHTNSET